MQTHSAAGRARNSFVLGVVSLVLGVFLFPAFLLGIPAWFMGRNVLCDASNGMLLPADESLARAGKIMGAIASILGVIAVTTALVVSLFITGFLREHVMPMVQDMSGGSSESSAPLSTPVAPPARK